MQGDDPAARVRQLLHAWSRTITVTRIQAGAGVDAFRVETSAFPELHAAAAAAVALPAANDKVPTPLFNDGIKTPENFNFDGETVKTCLMCAEDLIGLPPPPPPPAAAAARVTPGGAGAGVDASQVETSLTVGQSVTLRQLMCTQLYPGNDGQDELQPVHCFGGGHYFPHVYHGTCIEDWFVIKLQQHQPPACPHCKAVFRNQMVRPVPPVPQGPLVRLPHLHCLPHVGLCPRTHACAPTIRRGARALAA